MKIELKKISYNARLSQETSAYAADIWINGVRRGTVENNGNGGSDIVQPHSLAQELAAHAKTLPKFQAYGVELEHSLETILGELLDAHLASKRLARMLKTKVVFLRDGGLFTLKCAPTKANVVATKGMKPGVVVLNDLSLEDATRAFMTALKAQAK